MLIHEIVDFCNDEYRSVDTEHICQNLITQKNVPAVAKSALNKFIIIIQ